eukprot:m.144998 g.144998  ORF g.144998 m.144998 type:complete len:383 (+) comp30406_c0_seq2:237-1385(+)
MLSLITIALVSTAKTSVGVSQQNDCKGYVVQGAGSTDFDGCYALNGSMYDAPLFVLDTAHNLYRYDGYWRLGSPGHTMGYIAYASSDFPPVVGSHIFWRDGEASDPPPTLIRGDLPPLPPPPPAPTPKPVPPAPPAPPMRLVVKDNFDTPTLNESLWNVLEQKHRGGIYTRDNVFIRDGNLVLRTVARNMTVDGTPFFFASGAVNTSGLDERHSGRYSVRLKLPNVDASPGYTLHSSMWLFTNAHGANSSECPQEIDVFEQYAAGSSTELQSTVVGNLHPFSGGRLVGKPCDKLTSRLQYSHTGDLTNDWQVFTVDWSPDSIVMYLNNQTLSDFTNTSVVAAFTNPLFLALTACVMDNVPPLKTDSLPLEYIVDWVKIYEWI